MAGETVDETTFARAASEYHFIVLPATHVPVSAALEPAQILGLFRLLGGVSIFSTLFANDFLPQASVMASVKTQLQNVVGAAGAVKLVSVVVRSAVVSGKVPLGFENVPPQLDVHW